MSKLAVSLQLASPLSHLLSPPRQQSTCLQPAIILALRRAWSAATLKHRLSDTLITLVLYYEIIFHIKPSNTNLMLSIDIFFIFIVKR